VFILSPQIPSTSACARATYFKAIAVYLCPGGRSKKSKVNERLLSGEPAWER